MLCRSLLCGLLFAANNASAADWDIEALMAALGSHREGRATFVETTYLKMLERPLESSGELTFAAPNQLQKITLRPKREVLALNGDRLSIERNGRTRILQMSDYPQISVFIDSIRGTLMGDRTALEQAYRLSLNGSEQHWSLLLAPKGDAVKSIEHIEIGGSGGSVESVEIVQADGDRSVLRIANNPLPAAASESTP
ncbi:MAG TPA: LolA-related protein [Spongiibacteraceae bacterium]|nr:LolA-related protein [Spongiibacteraceae bacterium]